jgi:MFS superfamily sulfate permease-like transporter
MPHKDLREDKMFSLSSLKFDLKAGLIVFLVALPLCLGIALAQKVNLFSGLLAGIVGGIVVASISGSKLSISGPAAGLTSIVLAAIADLHSFNAFLLALVLAGIFQIIFGIVKAGIIGHYFPTAVIKGMLAGIGIILIMKQIPHLVGYDSDPSGEFEFFQPDHQNTFSELLNMINFVSPGSLMIGLVCLVLMFLWGTKFIKKKLKFLLLYRDPYWWYWLAWD